MVSEAQPALSLERGKSPCNLLAASLDLEICCCLKKGKKKKTPCWIILKYSNFLTEKKGTDPGRKKHNRNIPMANSTHAH